MKSNLPGLPTISALMLTTILTVWLGLWGPIDLSKLEKWQTLMASILALVAAGIAYRGATEKVRHDKAIAAAEEARRKLALYLKMEMACRLAAGRAHEMQTGLMFPPVDEDKIISRSTLFQIDEPPELEEVWAFLDLFPRKALAQIRNVRVSFRELAELSKRTNKEEFVWKLDVEQAPWVIRDANAALCAIWQSGTLVADVLEPLITEMAPEMDENERMNRIYGEPSVDE
ncbi:MULTISPECIES: hypothetical protein [unclassified Bradyrhizobium]|uniref:hypothetical protein n=1 Tax=unclassified Bradyrhizobium TaxID=2631580 RepID=UPI0028ED8C5B|nr:MULTISPECIES: hypothetical protein [unclassified Bradyrhizobium]